MAKKSMFKNIINKKWITVPLALVSIMGLAGPALAENVSSASAANTNVKKELPAKSVNKATNIQKELPPAIKKETEDKKIAKVNPPAELHWVKAHHQCQLYTGLKRNGTMYHPVKTIRPGYNDTFHLTKIIIMHAKNGKEYGRYKIGFNGHTYYATTIPYYMENCYYQPRQFKSHRYIRIILPCAEYRHSYYNKVTRIRYVHHNDVFHVTKIIPIGKDYQFRFVMANGDYITANKNFVQLI